MNLGNRRDAELLRPWEEQGTAKASSASTTGRTVRIVRRSVRLEHFEEEVVVVSCRDEATHTQGK